jgi:hypothetical protein
LTAYEGLEEAGGTVLELRRLTGIADAIQVTIGLVWIWDGRAVVAVIRDPIAIRVSYHRPTVADGEDISPEDVAVAAVVDQAGRSVRVKK